VRFFVDVRVAFRTLLRAPGFFAMATLVLALGIAAVAVMFGFLRVTMTPPPLDHVERVFSLSIVDRKHNIPDGPVRLHDIEDWGREQRSFEGVAGVGTDTVSFRREGATVERYLAASVTGQFFSILRVKPLLGRNLLADDARPYAAKVVVLSERLWRSAFGADPSAVGESVWVNGELHTVVGVAPAALDLPVSALLWTADRTDTAHDPEPGRANMPLARMSAPIMSPIGRLRDGVTPEAARAELQSIQARRADEYPEVASERPEVRPLSLLWMGSEYQRLVRVLFGSVLLVLALACVNVAGLLLVRGAGRTHEAAVRQALGAGRLRLAGQMLTESAVIGAAAALLAVVLAEGTMEALRRVIPALLPAAPSWWRMALDGGTLAFTLATAMVAALAAGVYPAVRAARVSVDPLLREGRRETGLHAVRLVRWLVVLEIALSSALLTAAGLVIRSSARLGTGDVGVPTSGYLIAQLTLPPRWDSMHQKVFMVQMIARLRAIPGVEEASMTSSPPGITAVRHYRYWPMDRAPGPIEDLPTAATVHPSPGYFETFRIPIVQGRGILDTDFDWGSSVAVVSESMARATWPGESPVGKLIRINPEVTWLVPLRIVGVAKDVRYDEDLRAQGTWPPVIYIPMYQWPGRWMTVTLRAPRDPMAAAEAIRAAARSLDSDVPVFSIRTLDQERERNAAGLTLIGRMFAVFGVAALALAAAAVYGVLAYSVAQGAREIAIRRALGAPRWMLVAAVLARSAGQLLLGLAIGVALAPVMGAMVGSVVAQPDPAVAVYAAVAGLLSATLLVSVAIPLRRALALEPAAALRHT
jgi:putative ABC transport system permease protein